MLIHRAPCRSRRSLAGRGDAVASFVLILKNLGRNPLRTTLTAVAILVLVSVVTLIWTTVAFLDRTTAEKADDLKMIVMERWHVPSHMPLSYADYFDPDPRNTQSIWCQQQVPRQDWP